MQNLNFPEYTFRFKNSENKPLIFDEIRKKFVSLTPEEWVRQHTIMFLMSEKKYPASHISVEKKLTLHNTVKRYDIVVYNSDGTIHLIVECKSYTISILQKTFDQIARYNLSLNATFLMITNGIDHYFCSMDFKKKKYSFLKDIPCYSIK